MLNQAIERDSTDRAYHKDHKDHKDHLVMTGKMI